ncbi:hypothetical protein LZK98_03775 [Sphingomonas cannabina]|uniref:hypothetical protein n=1 Tax=Sphingomonas cannabina TaxID=2899123 RepID=UPI001F2D3BCB|nr:hypothetical protein [Sphingomonas cannabina]UIJ46081.1 hypothetical protein LZK98_03775 [Sphingomonas cannabina]
MSASTTMHADVLPSAPAANQLAGLEPIERIRRRWPIVLAGLLTLAMVAGLAHELFGEGLSALSREIPRSPGYYIAFALLYMSPPTFDWLIFRRLWGLPVAGLGALIKKRVANEVVFGYSGEAYFYAWARSRLKMVTAPFGAVKDVSILSAIAGNAITLAMMALALPLARNLFYPETFQKLVWSAVVIVAMSLPFIIFSRRVFSLPRGTLWWVFGMHCLRLCFGSFMIALAWHFAMPHVSLGMWLLLAAGRLLVSRLPFVPNKDLLFANFAIILIGQGEQLSELIAFTAALTLLGHALFIAFFGIQALVRRIG